jgi:hypothetical protein
MHGRWSSTGDSSSGKIGTGLKVEAILWHTQ